MRIIANFLGVFLVLFGLVWILKGIDALPGNFVTGHAPWPGLGRIPILVGIVLLISANRHRKHP
jgi:uncharacterized membrane protein HdeD (DUF308 family)